MKKSKEVLDSCGESIGKRELMTQILYRMELYDEAYNSCKELIQVAKDGYHEERQANLAAINASLIGTGSVSAQGSKRLNQ